MIYKKTPVVDEKQASVTRNTMKQSISGKNPVLLQEEEEMYPKILMTMMAKMHKQMKSMMKIRTQLLQ